MIKRGVGLDAVGEKLVDQTVVEIEAFRIGRPVALRKYTRPGDREAISLHAQFLDQADVVLVEMIVIVGTIGVGLVADLARRVAEDVPDRGTAAVLVDGPFDLIGRGRGAPDEPVRKRPCCVRRERRSRLAFLRARAGPQLPCRTALQAGRSDDARIFRASTGLDRFAVTGTR